MCEDAIVGFNLTFDWFHICQTYTTLRVLLDKGADPGSPPDIIQYAYAEPEGRDGPCVKPKSACDLLLYARKGPYQTTMDRKTIRIKRVPKQLAYALSKELERRIPLKDIYFARKRDLSSKWQIYPIKDAKGREDPDFVDIVLRFAPSSALKALVVDAGIREVDSRLLFHDVEVAEKPLEAGYAPFALAFSDKDREWKCKIGGKEGKVWPGVIQHHIDHWRYDTLAREYATDDVKDTKALYEHFGCPEPGDDDSILACMIGATRWKGFAVDLESLRQLYLKARKDVKKAPKAPHHVYIYLTEVMDEIERESLRDRTGKVSTARPILETISKWTKGGKPHPAAIRARIVLEARKGQNKANLFNKILIAGRLHASATVIGSLSSRMSGRTEVGDGRRSAALNALGIQRDKGIRSCFPLAFEGERLDGGDFDAFEVSIADARYDDQYLRKQLCTCSKCGYVCTPEEYSNPTCPGCGAIDSRRKIHALFAMELFPGKSYEEIVASKGSDFDMYDLGKRGFFGGCLYGGDENTLKERLGIDIEVGKAALARFYQRYKGIQKAQHEIFNKFCSMRQPNGIGSRVEWHEPADYIESLNGFRRYYTLENRIVKALFQLAENPPKSWLKLRLKVVRRDRVQQAGNAVRSALFAAAFQIQAQNMRSATNHEIQSTGAILTKELQVRLWNLQPTGIHEWRIRPLNIHDEIMAPTTIDSETVKRVVDEFVVDRKSLIPLLKIDWKSNMKNWAEK